MRLSGSILWLLGLLIFSSLSTAGQLGRQGVYLAPGWGELSFRAPDPGSYYLPVMQRSSGGKLIATDGRQMDLADLLHDKVTLLSFIYRTCDDVNGCPLSTMVLRTVASRMGREPDLAKKLRLVTISFDPLNDTPAAMADYQKSIADGIGLDWHFLTSESDEKIEPILDAYEQFVVRDVSSVDGKGKFSHILTVYLIDQRSQIRNIYNLSFLHPDILVNDVKTLMMERLSESLAKRI